MLASTDAPAEIDVAHVGGGSSGWTPAVWVAIGGALLSALFSALALRTSRKSSRAAGVSAGASERSATTAERSLEVSLEERVQHLDTLSRHQASLVVAWRHWNGWTEEPKEMTETYVVHNGSELPIFDVTVWRDEFGHSPLKMGVLLSTTNENYPARKTYEWVPHEDELQLRAGEPLRMTFRDSSGKYWWRNKDGSLDVGKRGEAPPVLPDQD